MMIEAIDILKTARTLSRPWQPLVIAEANGFQVKVVRLDGEFPWHVHAREDEMFYCLEGSFAIELEKEAAVMLQAGDLYVVPAGAQHRPVAKTPALCAILERAETQQYGD
jgi:mannose-6-phosphate isomerase-like protein (cupin superfamily)